MLISSVKKKSKQFNLYGKLTKEKFNFDSNWIFYNIYIYIIVMVYYINDL